MYYNPDPRLEGFLNLVASEVAKFTDSRGIGSCQTNELFHAGQLALATFCEGEQKKDAKPRTVHRLTKPANYVRKAIAQAILISWQTDRQLHIPPSTRRGILDRGETPIIEILKNPIGQPVIRDLLLG